jgi:hypothetical protein
MGDENKKDREREVRDRIAGFMQANEQARKKQVTGEELQTLKAAAGRLDQLLKDTADADLQSLRAAGERLDRLLADIAAGKNVLTDLTRRRTKTDISE